MQQRTKLILCSSYGYLLQKTKQKIRSRRRWENICLDVNAPLKVSWQCSQTKRIHFITLDNFNIISSAWRDVRHTHGAFSTYNLRSVHLFFLFHPFYSFTTGHYHSIIRIMFQSNRKSYFFYHFYSDVNCFSKRSYIPIHDVTQQKM